MHTSRHSRVAGIGSFLPENKVTSEELMTEVNSKRFDIPENYISKDVGIEERRIADPGTLPSDLATLACESALTHSGVRPEAIDLILFTGITRDYEEPSTAHNVQKKLGAPNASCMDISNACLGFMTGMSVADAYIASGMAKTVLVCTGEMSSNTMHEFLPILKETNDKSVFKKKVGVLTVGDAGGAMVVQASDSDNKGWQWFATDSDGDHSQLCYYSKSATGFEGQMIMNKICAVTLARQKHLFNVSCQKLDWFARGADKIYCHQVGTTYHKQLLGRMNLDEKKAPISYDKYGNLTSATVPVLMTIDPPKDDEKLQFICSGSGISVFQGGMIF